MKTQVFPLTVKEAGVTATIRTVAKSRNGTTYNSFVVDYILMGKRKQVWRSDLDDAKAVARDACIKIANGEQVALELNSHDRLVYLRACDFAKRIGVPIDVMCREYADAYDIAGGKVTPVELAREWRRHHSVQLPRITIRAALDELERQAKADGKSKDRLKRMETILGKFAADTSVEVHLVTPDIVSRWLSGLSRSERTRRHYRDMVGFFCRWLVMRGYLAKGTDWLDGVQKYSKRVGSIEIYTPDELTTLLRHAERNCESMIPFLAIGAFAGLRHAEIARLDWSEIELSDQSGESFIEVKASKAKTDVCRLVPVRDNLKAWLLPHRKPSGHVCEFANITRQLLQIASDVEIEWKHNGLRHSAISYHVAQSADVPRVADEAGNSVTVIRTNYLRRVKPSQAEAWFNIMPETK